MLPPEMMPAVARWCAIVATGAISALAACSGPGSTRASQAQPPGAEGRLFTKLPPDYTGIRFENRLTPTGDFNVFTYRNFYNGGGAAAGDLTGDGLPEIVLTSNENGPRLYLNLGQFRFRDITSEAGISFKGRGAWTTGVTMADVNGDGLLDIYICYAGNGKPEQRANELYVNEGIRSGIPHFRESAADFGVADEGYSTQAAFLDYDRDGKLDLFLINNSPRPVSSFGLGDSRDSRSKYGGHKLYHNVGGRFVDVTAAARVHEAEMGFGLGLVVSDVNRDGWPDIYVANDFFEKDYLYINNHDGTFTESIDRRMPVISYSSMGMDIADVDNDGWPDVYTTDMLPEDEFRLKMNTSFDNWQYHQSMAKRGFHEQFTRNMLQLNNQDGTFSDVGQLAGVARTDWSWGALIADFDLDGNKDIFVTNGIARDVTSRDYLASLAAARTAQQIAGGKQVDFLKLVDAAPSTKLASFAFHNRGDGTFTNESKTWGLDTPGFSSGAVYADLDGDGALDLIVNRVDDTALVYRNNVRSLEKNRYLQLKLEGEGANRYAIGATVTAFSTGRTLFQEVSPTRGFQSSVDYVLTFGVGTRDTVDSLAVGWPDGRVSVVRAVATNQRLTVRQAESRVAPPVRTASASPLFRDVTDSVALPFRHRGTEFVDFEREPLMPKLLSMEGPALAVADVNGDGLDDVYFGGGKGQPGTLLIQQRSGRFVSGSETEFAKDSASDDVGAVFFDANGDGRPDLYVVSGGSEYSEEAPALEDRLYLNDGRGAFHKVEGHLPGERASGSRAAAADFDGDGDVDLFVGGRAVPWHYGMDAPSLLLRNDGRGHFTNVTDQVAPGLKTIGMVTDAVWRDIDGDGRPELIVVGDWMPITVFHNTSEGKLERMRIPGLEKSDGWWNRVIAGDFTGDGRVDFIVGNFGLNSRLKASPTEPVSMYVADFARNGFVQQVVASYTGGVSHPLMLRDAILYAIPALAPRFPTYKDFADKSVSEILGQDALAGAVVRQAYTFATSLARNNGDGTFTLVPLPIEAQESPIFGMLAADVDGDGRGDLLLAGNFEGMQPELGGMSASFGLLLRGDDKGHFAPVKGVRSGFVVPGQSRGIARVRGVGGAELYVVARYNDRPLVFRRTKTTGRALASGTTASSF